MAGVEERVVILERQVSRNTEAISNLVGWQKTQNGNIAEARDEAKEAKESVQDFSKQLNNKMDNERKEIRSILNRLFLVVVGSLLGIIGSLILLLIQINGAG